jgi:membrane-associated protease RseP (regulator of RpoE activity)
MFAIPAAKRTLVLIMGLALLVSAATAVAGDEKGYLGVVLQDISPSMAKALQIDEKTGVMVNEVVDDSPAARAGLEDGDIILSFNGEKITDYGDLTNAVRKTSPGDEVEVVVLRAGQKRNFDVEVGQHEAKNVFFMSGDGDVHAPHFEHFESDGGNVWVMSDDEDGVTWNVKKNDFVHSSDRGYMGVHLDDINEQMGEYFGVEGGEGALVTEVVEDSPAAAAGLKAGDVIVRLGGNEIDSPATLHKVIAGTEPEQQMAVEVVRKGEVKSLNLTLGEVPESRFGKHMEFIGQDGGDHFSIHAPPRMMKHFRHHGDDDVKVKVIRRGAPHDEDIEIYELEEIEEAHQELKMMREELDKMRQELKEMKKELDR